MADDDLLQRRVTKRRRREAAIRAEGLITREIVSSSKSSKSSSSALRSLEAADACARQLRASRPFILVRWVRLREYQRAGLDWLVSMQARRYVHTQ